MHTNLLIWIRPCTSDHPNAVCWVNRKGNGANISAKAFCTILYEILGWDTGYTYRVPAVVRSKGDRTVLFFDLDNYIGREIKTNQASEEEPAGQDDARKESDETQGIFFGADDEEVKVEESPEQMDQWMKVLTEYEKRCFGTPVFEHSSAFRLASVGGDEEWDVMTAARTLGSDYRVDDERIEALQDEMLEATPASEDDEGGGKDP